MTTEMMPVISCMLLPVIWETSNWAMTAEFVAILFQKSDKNLHILTNSSKSLHTSLHLSASPNSGTPANSSALTVCEQ